METKELANMIKDTINEASADKVEKGIAKADKMSNKALSAAVHEVDYNQAATILSKYLSPKDTQTALDRLFGEDF